MKSGQGVLSGLFILLILPITVAPAQALPLFSIGEGGVMTWSEAISHDLVQVPTDPLSGYAAQQFYYSQMGQTMNGTTISMIEEARNVFLTPDFDVSDDFGINGNENTNAHEIHQALVMSWENYMTNDFEDPAALNVAAWDYVYDVDPDLTGTEIRFSILAPPGVWDFSLELFDINGNSRGWFGTPPNNAWSSYAIRPDIAAAQGPFSAFYSQPGFDITQVTRIRLNESSQGGVSFFDSPLSGTTTTPWNAWNHLAVAVPEPSTWALFCLGLLGAGLAGRRSRRKK